MHLIECNLTFLAHHPTLYREVLLPNFSNHIKADLLLVLVTLIAASGWIFTKEALAGFPPQLFMGVRFLAAGLIVGLLSPQPILSLFRSASKIQWQQSLGLGIVFGISMILWVQGISLGDHIGEGAFITSIWVVLVPVVGWLLYRSPVIQQHQLAMVLALIGLGCLLVKTDFRFVIDQWLFIGSAFFLAIYFAVNSAVSAQMSTYLLTTIQLLTVGVVCLTVSLFAEPWPSSIPAVFWGWLLLSIVVATSLRFFLQTWAQGQTEANHAALIMTLEPVWAAFLGILWFSESMTLWQMSGCTLIFIALIVGRSGKPSLPEPD